MSVELISVLLAVVAVGVALRRLFLASSQRLGQDMARMESRLDGKISELQSQFESQINDLRDEVGELRARIVNYSGTAFVKLQTPPGTSRGSDASESQTSVKGSTPPIYTLDYPFNPSPRYVEGGRPYPLIYDLLNSGRESYYQLLSSFVQFKKDFLRIPKDNPGNGSAQPFWRNEFFTRLDAIALYGFLATNNPKRYFEIGSGYSTLFARQAIRDHQLQTTITSLDPTPRTDIDVIADVRYRTPLENCNLSLFDELEERDILFMDGSHRSFVNTDTTVFFMEVLPAVRPGVLVQIHDIKLPYDYPTDWMERLYNEQYLLGTYLLAETKIFEVLLPNALISYDASLKGALDSLYENSYMDDIPPVGGSFWLRKL